MAVHMELQLRGALLPPPEPPCSPLSSPQKASSSPASPPQSVSPYLPPTPPGAGSPPSSRLFPLTTPPFNVHSLPYERVTPPHQRGLLPFSIDNILKPDFGAGKHADCGGFVVDRVSKCADQGSKVQSCRVASGTPELLLRTPPRTPDVPGRQHSPVDLSHKLPLALSHNFLTDAAAKTNDNFLSHSISFLMNPANHPVNPFSPMTHALNPLHHHLQQHLLQQHAVSPHLQQPIITKPIPLSSTTAFQLLKPFNTLTCLTEHHRRLQGQHHAGFQPQLQHELKKACSTKTNLQKENDEFTPLITNKKDIYVEEFSNEQQQHSGCAPRTPVPVPSPTPSNCSTNSNSSSLPESSSSITNNNNTNNKKNNTSPSETKTLSDPDCRSDKSGSKTGAPNDSLEELVNPKIPEDSSSWPAWVYCTRYSDRPSSGPRSRRVKRRERNAEEKRPRTAFSSDQLARLKKEFEDSKYLTEKRRQDLARDLGLNESQIKIWFQNKRAKIKKSTGPRSGLAQHLMAQGLYNHCTVPVDEEESYLG